MEKNKKGFPTPARDKYKVYVQTCTYNQSAYIASCMKGVTMQNTDFPFVYHIIDDCSTDGEQDVIRAFMTKECDLEDAEYYDNDICTIVLTHVKTNPNCFVVVYFLKKNMYIDPEKRKLYKLWQEVCPYTAECEGDDYWIDDNKLQKQVDLLDKHPEYSICFSNVSVFNNSTKKLEEDGFSTNIPTVTTAYDLAVRNYIHTPATTYRYYRSIENKVDRLDPISLRDYPRWILLAEKGNIYKFEEKMAVYRLGSGIWSVTPDIEKQIKTIIMLSKLSIVLESPDVKKIIDNQITAYQKQAISENLYFKNKSKNFLYRIWKRFFSAEAK